MAFGIETYRPNGSVAMSGANKAGLFIEVLLIPKDSTSGSKVYSQVPVGALFTVIGQGGGSHKVSISDDGAGRAKVVWGASTYVQGYGPTDTYVLVFAKRVFQTSGYGIQVANDDGDQLSDFTYPVPQYAGSVQPGSAPIERFYNSEDNTSVTTHRVTVNLRPDANRIVLINLPDSTNDGTWYASTPFIPAGQKDYPVDLLTVHKYGAAYKVPTLHIFSLDGPVSGGGGFGVQYFNPAGGLVYDSSAENISIAAMPTFDYVGLGQPEKTFTVPLSDKVGVSIPFFDQRTYLSDDGYRRFRSIARRMGNTIAYQNRTVEHDASDRSGNFSNTIGNTEGCFSMVVDISQLSPGFIAGNANT